MLLAPDVRLAHRRMLGVASQSGFEGDRQGEDQCRRLVGYGSGCALHPSGSLVEAGIVYGALSQSSVGKHPPE